jgi:NADPH:quinone reductase-like Zn-dependent oxidoreductase
MRVFQIEGEWGFDHLKLSQRPEPKPGPNDVIVRMRAASLNYRDLLVPERGYGAQTGELPLIPISDGVGVVEAIGPEVRRVAVGDRVCPTFFQSWLSGEPEADSFSKGLGGPVDGAMTELMRLPDQGVVKVPAHLTDLEAATLPCAALTAWSALELAGIRSGDRVLIQGCGGVALFALQLAVLRGAEITLISSNDERRGRARAMGAAHSLNYLETPEWAKATRELTAGRGYDLVLELGGEKTLPQSIRCVRAGGTVALIGVLSGAALAASLGPVITRQVRLQGVTVGSRQDFEAMLRAVDLHKLQPVIDRTFPFEALKDALSYLKTGAQFGKICIQH